MVNDKKDAKSLISFETESKIGVVVEKQERIIKLNFRALLRTEQVALSILYLSPQPLKLSQIYLRVIQDSADQQLRHRKAGGTRYTDAILTKGLYKLGVTGIVNLWRKEGADFPALPTLRRMLVDFKLIGWVGVRNTGRDRYYYLQDNALTQLTNEMVQILDLPFDKPFKSSSILQKQLAKVRREAIKKELIRQTQKKAIKKFRRKKLKTTKEKKRGKQPPQFIRFA